MFLILVITDKEKQKELKKLHYKLSWCKQNLEFNQRRIVMYNQEIQKIDIQINALLDKEKQRRAEFRYKVKQLMAFPYSPEWNNELKEQIRNGDDYTCQECGRVQEQLNCKLSVHHIDYNKKNNKPKNLISLCKRCHGHTNFDRMDWFHYLKTIR